MRFCAVPGAFLTLLEGIMDGKRAIRGKLWTEWMWFGRIARRSLSSETALRLSNFACPAISSRYSVLLTAAR